jgi:hypothetical protein
LKGGLLRIVMPGLVPGIHVLRAAQKIPWMAVTSTAMTAEKEASLSERGDRRAEIAV